MINPDDYWVNNPLITPVNKALMYDLDIFNAVEDERERIIKLLEELDDEEWMGINQNFIALIKGENKGHNGAEHTPCCNDWGCYGCEDCDCPDCLEGENK